MPSTPTAIGALETRVLTRVVNVIAKQHTFLMNQLFPPSTHRPINRSAIQYDQLTENRYMAPFTTVNGDAAMLKGETGDSITITTPLIKMKDPVQSSDDIFKRMAGQTDILAGTTDVTMEYIESEIAKGLARMESSIQEREEWMVSQCLQGAISYKVENRANFTITLNKPAGNTIVPTSGEFWDETNARPLTDIDTKIKRRNNEVNGPRLTVGVCGLEAADAIRKQVEDEVIKLDTQRYVEYNSRIEFGNEFTESGAIYLGRLGGIDHWEYAEAVKDEDGTSTDLIRAKYIEYFSTTPQALRDREMIYGSHHYDLIAIQEGLTMQRRFSKSEMKTEPSSITNYVMSRPLPLFYRPDHLISFKAVSG